MRVGVDIGGTKIHAVLVDDNGVVAQQVRLPTGFGPTVVLETAAESVRTLARLAGVETGSFATVGVGIPGAVDSETGRVSHAVNLGLEGLELGRDLGALLGLPVRVENDVNAAAVGAFRLLGRPVEQSMAYLNLGTGLAAGLVLAGSLWRGSRGTAGEIGHIPVDPNGPLCPCGQRGCLETVASGSGVARQWPNDHPSPVHALFEAAADGDPRAIDVRDSLVRNVASAVRMLVLSVDVDSVVIGGGLSSLGGTLLAGVRGVFDEWERDSPFIASLDLPARVELVPSDFPAAAVGAALVGMTTTGGTSWQK